MEDEVDAAVDDIELYALVEKDEIDVGDEIGWEDVDVVFLSAKNTPVIPTMINITTITTANPLAIA